LLLSRQGRGVDVRSEVHALPLSRGAGDGHGEGSAALIPQVRACDLQKRQLYAILESIGHANMGGKGS
jgi:hypothetical protein